MRVMVIDDSKAMRQLERDVLSELRDVEVIEAADGIDAIHKLRDIEFLVDLILVDWVMPRMDGLTFVGHMKAQPNLASIPILMVTSCSDEGKMRRAWNTGVDGYLLKPFTKELFLKALVSLSLEFTSEVERVIGEESRAEGKSFLRELPEELRGRIIDMSVIMDVPAGEVVLSPGEVPQHFFFLEEGRVEERQEEIGAGVDARRFYGEGECFAVTELMARDPCTSEFRTSVATRLGRLPQVVFEGMLEKFPRISLTLSRCMASKARHLEVRAGREDEPAGLPEREEAGGASSELSGSLEVLDLPTLIQALSLRQKSCVIELPEIDAEITFSGGQVVRVHKGGYQGEEAFCRILATDPGRFQVVRARGDAPRNVGVSTMRLLLRAARHLDELKAAPASR
jgi:two-component system chemotaxis response regulator CheY